MHMTMGKDSSPTDPVGLKPGLIELAYGLSIIVAIKGGK